MNKRTNCLIITALALLGVGLRLEADIVYSPQGLDMTFVPVGNTGNALDVAHGSHPAAGRVDYAYDIGKYAVSVDQWNAANAAILDAGLSPLVRGASNLTTGSQPVNMVNWYQAARFANWLTTGDPDDGVYDTSAAGWGSSNAALYGGIAARDSGRMNQLLADHGRVYFLPTEDEWYKAAFHYNDGVTGNYWLYPTQQDVAPSQVTVGGGTNAQTAVYGRANWADGGRPEDVNQSGGLSAYGTMGQGGNVWEWNEALIGNSRGVRGGAFLNSSGGMPASNRGTGNPAGELDQFGFRVASIPEPASGIMLLLGALTAFLLRRRLR